MGGRVNVAICIDMKNIECSRECPHCKKLLFYSKGWLMRKAARENAVCKKCSHILYPRTPSEELKRRLSIAAKKKFAAYTQEQWQKMRDDGHKYGLLQLPLTAEEKIACCGSGNHFYGHTHTPEVRRKIGDRTRGTKLSVTHRMKISAGLKRSGANLGDKNVAKRPEERLRKRLAMIEKLKQEHGQMYPFYNKRACEYFDMLNVERGWTIQHGENGGEYYVKELGYWMDGYDKERNIVIEYDEPRHYTVNGQLKEKDVRRMHEIIDHLKCSFYRYDEKNSRLYKVI